MMSDAPQRIAVLYPAAGEETGDPEVNRLAAAVASRGAQAHLIPAGDDLAELVGRLRRLGPDLVFNLCDRFAGDPHLAPDVAAALELLEVPFTGAGAAGLHLVGDPTLQRRLLAVHGIPVDPPDDALELRVGLIGADPHELFCERAIPTEVDELARRAWAPLRLRDYALVRARVADAHAWIVGGVPNPSLSSEAPFVAAALRSGWDYDHLIGRIIDEAWARRDTRRRPATTGLEE